MEEISAGLCSLSHRCKRRHDKPVVSAFRIPNSSFLSASSCGFTSFAKDFLGALASQYVIGVAFNCAGDEPSRQGEF